MDVLLCFPNLASVSMCVSLALWQYVCPAAVDAKFCSCSSVGTCDVPPFCGKRAVSPMSSIDPTHMRVLTKDLQNVQTNPHSAKHATIPKSQSPKSPKIPAPEPRQSRAQKSKMDHAAVGACAKRKRVPEKRNQPRMF